MKEEYGYVKAVLVRLPLRKIAPTLKLSLTQTLTPSRGQCSSRAIVRTLVKAYLNKINLFCFSSKKKFIPLFLSSHIAMSNFGTHFQEHILSMS